MSVMTERIQLRVEVAFGADLSDDPFVWPWTDVSDSVMDQSISIKRGRADESSQSQPARTSFILDNPDGDFTSENPVGAHWPYVQRGTPCRVSVWWDSAWQVRFVGQVDSWKPTWPHGDHAETPEARVAVQASAFTRRLQQGSKPVLSPLRRGILDERDRLLAYWSLEDGSDASEGRSLVSGVRPFQALGSYNWAGDDTLHGSLPVLAGGSAGEAFDFIARPSSPASGAAESFSVECELFMPDGASEGNLVLMVVHLQNGWSWQLDTFGDGSLRIAAYDDEGGGPGGILSLDDVPWGGWFHLMFRLVAGEPTLSDMTAHVAAVAAVEGATPITNSTSSAIDDDDFAPVARVDRREVIAPTVPENGISYGHMVVTDGTSPDPIGVGLNTGLRGERADDRYTRLCTENGVAVAASSSIGEPMGPQQIDTLMNLLQSCEAADGGIGIADNTEFQLRYRPRVDMYNQTPAMTLDAAQGQIVNPFEPVQDDQRFINDAAVTRRDGGSAQAVDQTSVDAEGRYDTSTTVDLNRDAQTFWAAGWHLHLGLANGEMRYPAVSIELTIATEVIDDWLAMRVGDRLQVLNLPPQHPAGAVDLLAQGTNETISPARWTVQMNCTPGDPWIVGEIYDPGTEQIGGTRIDTDGCELDASIGEGDTTFDVTTTVGNRWTDDPSDMPFDIMIGGERMTVTAVSGTTASQTLTVTRAVNGVVKAHSVHRGSIRLADPCVIGW